MFPFSKEYMGKNFILCKNKMRRISQIIHSYVPRGFGMDSFRNLGEFSFFSLYTVYLVRKQWAEVITLALRHALAYYPITFDHDNKGKRTH